MGYIFDPARRLSLCIFEYSQIPQSKHPLQNSFGPNAAYSACGLGGTGTIRDNTYALIVGIHLLALRSVPANVKMDLCEANDSSGMIGVGMLLKEDDALIVVDVQRDFLPGGSLAVPDGDSVVPILNCYLQRFRAACLPIVATRDWHPPNHSSFITEGGSWPPHCIQDTRGAEFAEQLEFPEEAVLVSKATRVDADAYSGFDGTNLRQYLRDAGVRRLFIGGLTTDYCVLATVKDALSAGFEVIVLGDAIRAVNVDPGDGDKALDEMLSVGATIIELAAIDANG